MSNLKFACEIHYNNNDHLWSSTLTPHYEFTDVKNL